MVPVETLKRFDEAGIVDALLKDCLCRSEGEPSEAGELSPDFLLFKGSDGVELVARVFAAQPSEPHVFYLPGEFDTDADVAFLAGGLGRHGISLVSLDYRGCGKSEGEQAVGSLFEDATSFYDAATSWMSEHQRPGPVAVMGRSLGCAVAIDLARRHDKDILCLVLDSAFDLTDDFLKGRGLPECDAGECDPFSNRAKMKEITKPVLFLHSSRDEVVSLTQVEWLVMESRSKATQFQVVPCGGRKELARATDEHYFNAIKDFLHKRLGRRPPRKPRKKRTIHS